MFSRISGYSSCFGATNSTPCHNRLLKLHVLYFIIWWGLVCYCSRPMAWKILFLLGFHLGSSLKWTKNSTIATHMYQRCNYKDVTCPVMSSQQQKHKIFVSLTLSEDNPPLPAEFLFKGQKYRWFQVMTCLCYEGIINAPRTHCTLCLFIAITVNKLCLCTTDRQRLVLPSSTDDTLVLGWIRQ